MRKLSNEELQRIDIQSFKESEKTRLIVILDDVRSLNNIGSIFRSCDAFRIEKLFLCGITACPPHKDIHKTALGATESVDWEYRSDILTLLQELNKQGIETIAIEQAEKSIFLQEFSVQREKKYAVIFGNEVKGVQQSAVSLCKKVIEIPQFGTKHSLNVSVTAGIVLYDISSKLQKL